MKDYSTGKIYAIWEADQLLYIGSTVQKLSQRMALHRANSKQPKNASYPLYKYVNERPDKWEGLYIELVETYPCESNAELERREGEYIRNRKPPYNKHIEGRTRKEWCEDNREAVLEYHRQYREANRETILEQRRQYREANRDSLCEKNRQYREANREKISEYKRQYHEANREKRNEYNRQYRARKRAEKEAEAQ